MNARTDFTEPPSMLDATASLRIPPHSIEAESSVLGGLLLDNSAWDVVGDLLVETDFYRREHQLVFAAICALVGANKPADVVTVFERIQSLGKADEFGGLVFLNDLAQYVPSARNIRRYAEIVRERAVLRKLVSASDEIASEAFSPEGKTAAEIVDAAEQKIFGVSAERAKGRDEWVSIADSAVMMLDKIQAQQSGDDQDDFVPTGLRVLDEAMNGGMRPGEVVIVGARPGMGKSALGLTAALNVARGGMPVGFFSLEMPNAQSTQRATALLSGIHLSRIKRGNQLGESDWPKLADTVDTLRTLPFFMLDTPALNIIQLRSKARALARRMGQLGLIVVDYLQLMSGSDHRVASRTYQLEEASRGLKSLAKEIGCPVMALAQVNRKVEREVDPMPRMSDLKDCGAIEQDADIIMFLHRPIKENPGLGPEWEHYAKCSLAKVRDGATGIFDLQYVGPNTRFADWPQNIPVPTSRAVTKRGADL